MPYIKKEERNKQTIECPLNRGQLNYSIITRSIRYFNDTKAGYNDHCELKALLNEILQGIVNEVNLEHLRFEEFSDHSRDFMKEIDQLVWDYLARTADTAGCKQVIRDVIHEWNRRMTDPYEEIKVVHNGDVF